MQTYCLSRRKYTGNFSSKIVIMTIKVIRQKSRCSSCAAKLRCYKMNSWLKNFISQLSENFKKEKFFLLLKTIFWVLI